MSLANAVRALKEGTKAEVAAVIHRDGRILVADLPASVSQETFSIMCAAILGAGMTASMQLHHEPPGRVLLESEDAVMHIREVGRRAMLVLVVPPGQDAMTLDAALARFVESTSKDLA